MKVIRNDLKDCPAPATQVRRYVEWARKKGLTSIHVHPDPHSDVTGPLHTAATRAGIALVVLKPK